MQRADNKENKEGWIATRREVRENIKQKGRGGRRGQKYNKKGLKKERLVGMNGGRKE